MGGNLLEKLRIAAEKPGPGRLPAKALVCLAEEGPKEAGFRVRMRLGRARAERAYVRKRFGTDFAPPGSAAGEDLRFSVIVPLYNTPEVFLREMIDSVRAQTWGNWELCLADGSETGHAETERICREAAETDSRIRYRKLARNGGISENSNAALEMAEGDWIALLDHDDLLMPDALEEAAKAAREGADFVYSDELVFLSPNRKRITSLHLKPDFAPDNLLANNYICHLTAFRASLLARTGGFRSEYDGSQDHDLILRLTAKAGRVTHVRKPLYLWRSHEASVAGDIGSKGYAAEAGRRAVEDHLRRQGIAAAVENSPVFPTMYRVRYELDDLPRVSVILWGGTVQKEKEKTPAKAGTETAAAAVRIKGSTDYPDVEWIPAEGDGTEALNRAAGKAAGEVLVFLDARAVPEGKDWIREMLMYALRENTGAVGGKMLFQNGRVRQAGLILGLGPHRIAGRGHYLAMGDGPGYYGRLAVAEDVSALSGECLMIRKTLFEEMGGLDAAFPGPLADADLCLRLREKGMLNVYTPFASFRGGASREIPLEAGAERPGYEEAAGRFRERWKDVLAAGDPYYHPDLSTDIPDYRPGKAAQAHSVR